MCRIFGAFNTSTTAHELRTVSALLRHGGPDAQTFIAGDDWALGNNRLAIMAPAGGQQPYRLGDVTVVYNGEIYNHRALRDQLASRGITVADQCDGAVLPALYLEYGDAFVDHLDGMYAIAVLDQRAEPRLLLANDHAGMKPLYYYWDSLRGQLKFASELPALLAFSDVPAVESPLGLDAYLAHKTPFTDETMFAGISVLPPASLLSVSRDGFSLRQRTVERDLSAAAGSLQELLAEEVRRLRIADAPVAAVTSGGLDSSLVTALLAQLPGELHTFNIAYSGNWPHDERAFAREVAEAAGTVHHQVELDPADFPELLSEAVWHLGQPNADPITLSTFALFRAVSEAGFKVALTGDAADELFGGYGRMTAAVNGGDNWLPPYLDSLAAVPHALRHSLYRDDFAAALVTRGSVHPDGMIHTLTSGEGSRLRRICDAEQRWRLPSYHLRRVDHLSMASAIEVRLPFCQPAVYEYAAGLPDGRMITEAGVKRALYASAEGLLPASVLNRPKQPFTLPITAMLAPGSALWTMSRDVLSEQMLRADGRLKADAVNDLFDRQAARPNDTDALAIWSLAVYQLWRDQFLSGGRRAPQLQGALA